MEYKITGSKSKLSKAYVSFRCPVCTTSLKSPLAEAGNIETCPKCHKQVEVPGKSDYERLLSEKNQHDAEEQVRIEAVRREREEIQARVNQYQEERRKESEQQSSSTGEKRLKWHEEINKWIVSNLSLLNAYAFFIIWIFGTISTMVVLGKLGMESFLAFLLAVTSSMIVGFMYCGVFAIILSVCKDLSRIADSAEKRLLFDAEGETTSERP